jgi:hypothetical protein
MDFSSNGQSWGGRGIKIKILSSECQTSGTYAKTAKQATTKKTTPRLACFFLTT